MARRFVAEDERTDGFIHVVLITTGSVASIKAPLIVTELLTVRQWDSLWLHANTDFMGSMRGSKLRSWPLKHRYRSIARKKLRKLASESGGIRMNGDHM